MNNQHTRTPHVMVAGHISFDLTPIFLSKDTTIQMLSPGKLIEVGQAEMHSGGAVANTGLGMKLMGADVKLVAKIGDDSFGELIKYELKKYDADKDLIIEKNIDTSYTIILAMPKVDRIFLHNPGANNYFYQKDIPDDILNNIDHFHFGYPPLMEKLFENNGKELIELFQRVKSKGITTSLDMVAIDPNSKAGQANWISILTQILPYIDFFVPSIEEVCFMLDRQRYDEWNERAQGNDITHILNIQKDIKPLADQLINMGASVLVLKCGASGMYYCCNNHPKLQKLFELRSLNVNQWKGIEGFMPSFRVDHVVSGTGAGDASIAAFLMAMLQGYSFKRSVEIAAASGACCVASYDALSGIKSLDELESMINAGWEHNNILN